MSSVMLQMGCKVSVSIASVSLYLGLKLQLAHTQRKTQLLTTCVSISFNETALTDEHFEHFLNYVSSHDHIISQCNYLN